MILLVIVASLFYRTANKKMLNGILWSVLAVLTWFGSQFIAGLIIGLTNPRMLDNDGGLILWGIVASVAGTVGLYVLMEMAAKKKLDQKPGHNDDIMDDTNFDEL